MTDMNQSFSLEMGKKGRSHSQSRRVVRVELQHRVRRPSRTRRTTGVGLVDLRAHSSSPACRTSASEATGQNRQTHRGLVDDGGFATAELAGREESESDWNEGRQGRMRLLEMRIYHELRDGDDEVQEAFYLG